MQNIYDEQNTKIFIKGSIQSCTCKILPHLPHPNPSCSEPLHDRRDMLCITILLHEVSVTAGQNVWPDYWQVNFY